MRVDKVGDEVEGDLRLRTIRGGSKSDVKADAAGLWTEGSSVIESRGSEHPQVGVRD